MEVAGDHAWTVSGAYLSFLFLPVVLIAILAFTNMDSAMRWEFAGLANFQKLLADPNIMKIIKNTALYVGFTLLINVGFGFVLGILTSYYIQKESVGLIFRTIWMLPRMSPPVVYVLLWLWFFDPSEYGVLNSLRALFHMEPVAWLHEYPMTAVILANGIIGASFGMIIFRRRLSPFQKICFTPPMSTGRRNGRSLKISLSLLSAGH